MNASALDAENSLRLWLVIGFKDKYILLSLNSYGNIWLTMNLENFLLTIGAIIIKAEILWKVLAVVYFTEVKYLLEDARSRLLQSVSTVLIYQST